MQRIGKYKSAGDQINRSDMSEAQREVLGTILEDVYENFVTTIAADRGHTKELEQQCQRDAHCRLACIETIVSESEN